MRALRGFAFWTTAGLMIIGSLLLAAPVFWQRRWASAIIRGVHRVVMPVLVWITGAKLRVAGKPTAELQRTGYILISNHSSNLDVVCLERAAGYPGLQVVIKSEVSRLPVMGWYLRGLGWIGVDRGQAGSAEKLIDTIGDRRSRRAPHILIFPEGTRTRDGALQRFRLGPFLMAVQLQLPILPAVIRGARPCHPRGALGFTSGPVSIEFAEPLVPPPVASGESSTVSKQQARLAQELQRQARAIYENVDFDRAS